MRGRGAGLIDEDQLAGIKAGIARPAATSALSCSAFNKEYLRPTPAAYDLIRRRAKAACGGRPTSSRDSRLRERRPGVIARFRRQRVQLCGAHRINPWPSIATATIEEVGSFGEI